MEFPTSRSMRMITSVSMLLRMIGAAIAVSLLNGFGMSALHCPYVGNGAGDRGGRGGCRACQMGSGPGSLAADKVAIGGGDRTLAWRHGFAVGGETHRASGLAPFEAGIGEKLVESFGDRVALDRLRAGHDPGPHTRCNLAATNDFGSGAQITQAAIGAGADEDPVDWRAGDRRAWFQAHILERRLDRGAACRIVD